MIKGYQALPLQTLSLQKKKKKKPEDEAQRYMVHKTKIDLKFLLTLLYENYYYCDYGHIT